MKRPVQVSATGRLALDGRFGWLRVRLSVGEMKRLCGIVACLVAAVVSGCAAEAVAGQPGSVTAHLNGRIVVEGGMQKAR